MIKDDHIIKFDSNSLLNFQIHKEANTKKSKYSNMLFSFNIFLDKKSGFGHLESKPNIDTDHYLTNEFAISIKTVRLVLYYPQYQMFLVYHKIKKLS